MQEKYNKKKFNDLDDEINLLELFNILWDGKWIIVSLTTFVSIIGVIYSLLLPNIYESKALLAPINPSSNISGAFGTYSGLAALPGINFPNSDLDSNSAKALKTMTSLSFFENNILTNIFLPDLMALKSWNQDTNKATYDDSIFEKTTNSWKQVPSTQQGFKAFNGRHLSLNQDKISGFITLSVKHKSPYIAKEWAELVIDEVNSFYRQKDKEESEKAVKYLNQQISNTGLSEIKQVLAQLLQEEIKKLTLIEANEFYVFDYIDPPAVMEKKSEPQRAIICILSAIIGGIFSILFVFIRHYFFKEETT